MKWKGFWSHFQTHPFLAASPQGWKEDSAGHGIASRNQTTFGSFPDSTMQGHLYITWYHSFHKQFQTHILCLRLVFLHGLTNRNIHLVDRNPSYCFKKQQGVIVLLRTNSLRVSSVTSSEDAGTCPPSPYSFKLSNPASRWGPTPGMFGENTMSFLEQMVRSMGQNDFQKIKIEYFHTS